MPITNDNKSILYWDVNLFIRNKYAFPGTYCSPLPEDGILIQLK